MRISVWLFIASSCLAVNAYPTDSRFSPFSEEETAIRQSRNLFSESSPSAVLTDTEIADDSSCAFRILVNAKEVYSEEYPYSFHKTDVIVIDLDGNGFDDVVKFYDIGKLGLGLGCELLIFSQHKEGEFRKIALPSERFTEDDIRDLNKDGRIDVISCTLVRSDSHSYWLYRCWYLTDDGLGNQDSLLGFPRAIQFTHGPNNRLVSPETLEELMQRQCEEQEKCPEGLRSNVKTQR